ncbi:conjugal transfer protein TraX (plasmid) [Clostridium estertheticum]|uniref:TraX family protein n=1 Tax=Clostridium estertheticum TaxID=238834 RepID=UPI001C7D74E5|nr:TraX family protein [Clostridium estertheticum]MBX4262172.1 conjugal transfer protein TraX [Clostridium estertheticum]WLC73184.1 conjugal transfer protein TraX [Clostridium estertheticum]
MKTMIEEFKKKSISGNTIKIIAIIAMIIDHVGWAFVSTNTIGAAVIHTIGKITGPIMCYFIAEGNHYSKNRKKYLERLAIFALISHVPYNIFDNQGTITLLPTSVIFTLMCGFLALIVFEKIEHKPIKLILILLLVVMTYWADWQIFGVLFILAFGIFYGNYKRQMVSFAFLSFCRVVYELFVDGGLNFYLTVPRALSPILVILLLSLYNGAKGGSKYAKWAFYIIYPLQFLIIGGIVLLLGRV